MSRLLSWRSHTMEFGGKTRAWTDYIADLGPFRAFTLSSIDDGKAWLLCSHFIPSKMRNAKFSNAEEGKRVAQKIVDDFTKWLSG